MEEEKGRRVMLVVNPSAGRMRSKTGLFDIVSLLNKNGFITTVHITSSRGDATEAVMRLGKYFDCIVSCGGDGTLNEVMTAVLKSDISVPIGYIPTGTANDLAASLGLSRNIKKATEQIMFGKIVPHDVGFFNSSQYFSYVASFGAFTKVSYATSQPAKNAMGYLAYFIEGVKNVAEIHPYTVSIKADDFETEGDFIFAAVTNSTSVGGILKYNQDTVNLQDGIFEVLLIRNPQNAMELQYVVNGLTKQVYDKKYVNLFHTSSISFKSERPISWTVDGEYAGDHNLVQIENLHRAVRIIRPK